MRGGKGWVQYLRNAMTCMKNTVGCQSSDPERSAEQITVNMGSKAHMQAHDKTRSSGHPAGHEHFC